MPIRPTTIDAFNRNLLIVFSGATVLNLFNFFYQLFMAHSFSAEEFAAINTLISLYSILTVPLATFQTAVVKFISAYLGRNQLPEVNFLLSRAFLLSVALALLTLALNIFILPNILVKLNINYISVGYSLSLLFALGWIIPVLYGALQGFENFFWFSAIMVGSGGLKLFFAFVLVSAGFGIAGAIGAFLFSQVIIVIGSVIVLSKRIHLGSQFAKVNFGEFFVFMVPVALSSFCFMALVSADMVLVKLFFNPQDAGAYSLAQMLGKIFLFLPAAINMVLLPRSSSLSAQNQDTVSTLKKSLGWAILLCGMAVVGYNLFPSFVLKLLTAKALPAAILLGRFFSISMGFYTILFVIITYFLSIAEMRFLKYLIIGTVSQIACICLFHKSLLMVQWIMCIHALLLFLIHFKLIDFKKCRT